MAVDFFYSVDVIKCFLDIGRIPIRMMNYLRCLLLAFFIAGRGYPPVRRWRRWALPPEPDAVQNVVLGINNPRMVTATIGGNAVTLAGMRFTVTVMQTLLFTPVTTSVTLTDATMTATMTNTQTYMPM